MATDAEYFELIKAPLQLQNELYFLIEEYGPLMVWAVALRILNPGLEKLGLTIFVKGK